MKYQKKYENSIIKLDDYTFADGNINECLEVFERRLKVYINLMKEIIESDFSKLSDEEFYKLLCKTYNIQLEPVDYLDMLSYYNNKEYIGREILPTTMVFKSLVTEGHGRSFDYWEEPFQVYYDIMISRDFKITPNKVYTKDEVKKLVDDKSIVLMNRHEKKYYPWDKFEKESFEELPTIDVIFNDYSNNITDFVLNNINLLGNLLRKEFTKKKVLNDIKEMIIDLDLIIEQIFNVVESKDERYSKIARLCKEWYDSSKEKEDFNGIQKKLKITHNV